MIGLFCAVIAGGLVSVQNIFNSRVNEAAGSWATTALVLGLGFAASVTLGLLVEGKRMFTLPGMQGWYWLSGLIGVGVVTCMVQAFRLLGPTFAIAIVLTSQLVFALLWDWLGWMGLTQVPFRPQQVVGVLVIILGIVIFKFGGRGVQRQGG